MACSAWPLNRGGVVAIDLLRGTTHEVRRCPDGVFRLIVDVVSGGAWFVYHPGWLLVYVELRQGCNESSLPSNISPVCSPRRSRSGNGTLLFLACDSAIVALEIGSQ